jgi:hypothetical protein
MTELFLLGEKITFVLCVMKMNSFRRIVELHVSGFWISRSLII